LQTPPKADESPVEPGIPLQLMWSIRWRRLLSAYGNGTETITEGMHVLVRREGGVSDLVFSSQTV